MQSSLCEIVDFMTMYLKIIVSLKYIHEILIKKYFIMVVTWSSNTSVTRDKVPPQRRPDTLHSRKDFPDNNGDTLHLGLALFPL